MRLAFCLFHYFPFGGRERNLEATARLCAAKGHEVHVFTRAWEGDRPKGVTVHALGQSGWTNIGRDVRFVRQLRKRLEREEPFDALIGFDLIPGLDVFYAADPCTAVDVTRRSWLSQRTRRSRYKLAWERALLAPGGAKQVLVLTEEHRNEFVSSYPQAADRIEVLPGNLEDAPLRTREEGARFLEDFGITEAHQVLLFVGSDFQRKGLDRVIEALPHWPANTRLLVAGDDDAQPYAHRTTELGLEQHVRFLGPLDDVSLLHARADLLIHPARKETAGVVLLEAMRHGVPVVTTEVCGFATHVEQGNAGFVLSEPYRPGDLQQRVASLLESSAKRRSLGENAREYARRPTLYGRQERIREIIEALDPEGQRTRAHSP